MWIKLYEQNSSSYPSTEKILKYIKKVEILWKKNEAEILKELSRIIGLRWASKHVYCYVVGRCVPFSDPLTLPVYEKYPDYFIDNLIHEMIHQLFTQGRNLEQAYRAWKYLKRKYKGEPHDTIIHIPLHAAYSHICMKFFSVDRLKKDIKLTEFLSDYKKSWSIVQRDGYKSILYEFRNRCQKDVN